MALIDTHVPKYLLQYFFYSLSTMRTAAVAAVAGRNEMNEKVLWDVMWEFDTRIG